MADAASALTGFAVPVVPVKTSTLPAFASAGDAPAALARSAAHMNASASQPLDGRAAMHIPIPNPSSERVSSKRYKDFGDSVNELLSPMGRQTPHIGREFGGPYRRLRPPLTGNGRVDPLRPDKASIT